jgi:oxygen-independent coproporphyrinogen-3 oxidase
MEDFLKALHNEIDLYSDYAGLARFETIFLGGGTPSLLTPPQLESILDHLQRVFTFTADAEVTVETNPGTVTQEKLSAYRSMGVNRLSVGVQSFFDDDLQFLGRIHNSEEAIRCVKFARGAGFENLSLDFIYSLPGQTVDKWMQNLRTAVSLAPEHISAYSLIVEEHTPLARMVAAKQVSPNPTETEAELYELTMQFLAANGFDHYEVSNYARPGFRSRHNYNYWRHRNYLGFGPSAHSYWKNPPGKVGDFRWWNIADVSHYCEKLYKNELPLVSREELSRYQLLTETIFLGLRSDGVNLPSLANDLAFELIALRGDLIDGLVHQGSVTIEDNILRLTPKGYLVCDEICERMLP